MQGDDESPEKKMKSTFKSPVRQDPAKAKQDSESLKKEIEKLLQQEAEADQQIEELKAQGYKESELDLHITSLHHYNEMRDIGQMLLGHIAQKEGVTTKDLYEKYGLDIDD